MDPAEVEDRMVAHFCDVFGRVAIDGGSRASRNLPDKHLAI